MATRPLIPDAVFLGEEPEAGVDSSRFKIGIPVLSLVGCAIVYFAFGYVSENAERWILGVAIAVVIAASAFHAANRRARKGPRVGPSRRL